MTPPDLLRFSGSWPDYEEKLYRVFLRDFTRGKLHFRGKRVAYRKEPQTNGRYTTFWHIITQGPVQEEREPNLSRCERLPWVRWIIENADQCSDIDVWQNKRWNVRRFVFNTLLWYSEEYLVVLKSCEDYWFLTTAYCTSEDWRVRKLRRERDSFLSANLEEQKPDQDGSGM